MFSELISDRVRNAGIASLPTVKRAAGAVTKLIPIPQPVLLVGPGSAAKLGQTVADFGHRKLLLVTDAVITRLGLAAPLTEALRAAGTAFVVFDAITPDAPIPVIEQGLELYRSEGCDAVIAVGGGSVMDAAKVIALAATNGKRPRDLAGYFRGLRAPAPIYVVPTTAGTGSEVTVAAIISDPAAGRKYMVADSRIVPDMAALYPTLMLGLPPAVTAATGMDALTHAVEAFISDWATPATDRWALAATGMIWQHLPRVVREGNDLVSREKMALASTYAGLAFTRANVGNVHAIAHQLGGKYHVPAGTTQTQMKFEFAPEALAAVLRTIASETDKPILISENGAAVADDRDRVEFIGRSLAGVHQCIFAVGRDPEAKGKAEQGGRGQRGAARVATRPAKGARGRKPVAVAHL